MEQEEVLKIECDVNKRRKCDSAYIHLYNKLMKDYMKLKTELEEYKQLCSIYKEILDESVDYLKGGEKDGQTRNGIIK